MTVLPGPGVRRLDVVPPPPPVFGTGIPAFLGTTVWAPDQTGQSPPVLIGGLLQFRSAYGGALAPADDETPAQRAAKNQFAAAVEGFFAGGGVRCWVAPVRPAADPADPADAAAGPGHAVQAALAALDDLGDVDLIAAPELVTASAAGAPDDVLGELAIVQRILLDHCASRGDRFALLDSVRDPRAVPRQAELLRGRDGGFGALYHPWLLVPDTSSTRDSTTGGGATGYRPGSFVPPCGHVAGSIALTDAQTGVHKAPANLPLTGVLDAEYTLDDAEVARLSDLGVNCLRARPQRGVRAWGARTLSNDPARISITVPRLLGMVSRWLQQFMTTLAFEPNDIRLWVRILREVTAYLERLYRQGALVGRSYEEAFFVKCDTETNSPAVIDAGLVVTQIGLAPAVPAEFIVVRVVQDEYGTTVQTTT